MSETDQVARARQKKKIKTVFHTVHQALRQSHFYQNFHSSNRQHRSSHPHNTTKLLSCKSFRHSKPYYRTSCGKGTWLDSRRNKASHSTYCSILSCCPIDEHLQVPSHQPLRSAYHFCLNRWFFRSRKRVLWGGRPTDSIDPSRVWICLWEVGIERVSLGEIS